MKFSDQETDEEGSDERGPGYSSKYISDPIKPLLLLSRLADMMHTKICN